MSADHPALLARQHLGTITSDETASSPWAPAHQGEPAQSAREAQ
jgi:hypothetical protein